MFDVSRPFPAEDNECTLGQFSKHNSTNPMVICIHYPDVIRPTRDQLLTLCWFFGRFAEEGLTPLKRREDNRIPLQIYIWWALLEDAVARNSRPHPAGMLLNTCCIFKMVDS